MKTITMILTGLLIMLTPLITVAKTSLPAPENMVRLGHGEVRYLNLIKVYSATLYADNTYLSSDTSRCLVLNYEVSLKPDDMITAANKILEKQYSAIQLAPYLKQIETLHNSYRSVEKGDYYSLCYTAQTEQTTLALNGKQLTAITSPDFAKLYFGIWLSEDQPIDKKLQSQLIANEQSGDNHESS